MCLEAAEDDVDVLGGERMALDVVAIAGVVEQCRVESLEQAVVDHDLLPAAPFLGRGAKEHDLAGQLVGDGRERDGRADAAGRHGVVAAAVAQARRASYSARMPIRVLVTSAAGSTALAGRANGRRETARRELDGVPVTRQDLGDPCGGVVFLERGLGIGVDAMRQVDDLVPCALDGRGQPTLGVGVRFGGADGDQIGQETSGGTCRAATVLLDRPKGSALDLDAPPRRAERSASMPTQAWRLEPPGMPGRSPRLLSARRRASPRPPPTSATMNSAIGSSRTPWTRNTTRTATTRPTHAPRRAARIQSPVYAMRRCRPNATSQKIGTVVSPTASPMSAAPMKPAPGSSIGSRVSSDERDEQPDDGGRAEDGQVGQPVARLHDQRV